MNIRPAQPGDLPALLEIFAHARAFMAQTGNPTQWPATYPGAELMQQLRYLPRRRADAAADRPRRLLCSGG